MSMVDEQSKFAELVAKLILTALQSGFQVTLGEAYRTREQQEIYYNADPPLTKTLKSKHMNRLAVDLNFFKDGNYLTDGNDFKELGEYWKTLSEHCVWGGDWGWDAGHFEWKI